MIRARCLTEEGISRFKQWIDNPSGSQLPANLLDGDDISELFGEFEIDPERVFKTRHEFGIYLNERLTEANFAEVISSRSDGLWAWLAAVYFAQLTMKGIRRSEHYIVTRQGSAGSLAYRHSVRTPYELVHVHGEGAEICLSSPIYTLGDMTEQLASRQTIAHNKGFFQTAFNLYMKDGKLKRGAASKPKKPKDRKLGDRTGFGSIRRLAIALQRLNLTFDTEIMRYGEMIGVLPKEFAKWSDTI